MAIGSLRGFPGLALHEARIHEDARGAVAIWSRPTGLLVTRAFGTMTAARAKLIEETADRLFLTSPRHVALHDWDDLTDYDIEARLRLTQVAMRLRDVVEVHVVVRSRVITAAVEAAGAILKNLHIHRTRTELERQIALYASRHGGPPPT